MTRRRIAIVAPPWYPLPPKGYGGTELVVALLARGLRAAGHDVLLYGAEGSTEPNTIQLAPARWADHLLTHHQGAREAAYIAAVVSDLEQREPVDVIHDHCNWAGLVSLALTKMAPVVHTVHGQLHSPARDFYQALGERVGLISISHNQRRTSPDLHWAGTVHNAVDVDELHRPGVVERNGYLVCLARISPEKGQHIAIEVARRTGRRLILAGKVGEEEAARAYWQEIRRDVDGDRVVYISNVAGRDKADLLAGAHALLAPLQWPEPFGLAMAEAMASGTPTIAFPRGAAPELVCDGITGRLVKDIDEMVEAVEEVAQIDPQRCARITRDCFSPAAMARGYAEVYERVLNPAATTAYDIVGRAVGRDDAGVDGAAAAIASATLVI